MASTTMTAINSINVKPARGRGRKRRRVWRTRFMTGNSSTQLNFKTDRALCNVGSENQAVLASRARPWSLGKVRSNQGGHVPHRQEDGQRDHQHHPSQTDDQNWLDDRRYVRTA